MRILIALALTSFLGCSADRRPAGSGGTPADPDASTPLPDLATEAPSDLARALPLDGACAVVVEEAQVEVLPVDIIWMVDNSSSMKPAVEAITAGLNDFAQLIGGKNLDYHIIMLSIRNKNSPVQVNGGTRYPVCIPPPLSGDMACGNGLRFVQSSIDIKSTQPLEQLLGTLGQTDGYRAGQERGGEPWAQALRQSASKTIVVVTDDNARLSPTDFETFAGGKNPFAASVKLPPGILDPSWNGLFDGYTFDGIYGWGSDMDPFVMCQFVNGSFPASPGPVYSHLVAKTGGVRARICDGPGAWAQFFDDVAQAVVRSSKLTCDLAIPPPPEGQQAIDPGQVNVQVTAGMTTTVLPKVKDAAACGNGRGWYYDNDQLPTRVLLCPGACSFAQGQVKTGGRIEVAFGCDTVLM